MKEKISKICWNDFKWTKPSGTNGKSPSSQAYENKQGYGHEEWLLDKSRLINKFHYGFLQPLNLKSDLHVNKAYKIWLYAVTRKKRLLIGNISNAICISKNESSEIYKIYKQKGWLKEMIKDVGDAGLNPLFLKQTTGDIFFNVKFKPNDIHLSDNYQEISSDDINLTTTRYKLLDKISDFLLEDPKQKGIGTYIRTAIPDIVVDPYHNKIQNILSKLLKSSGRYYNIRVEKDNVDVQANLKNGSLHFFEIKTDTPKNNIRQALGQLLEYSMYPNKQKADKLIVVGDTTPSKDTIEYIEHLRAITNLNLYYRWVDVENNTISQEL